MMILKGKIRKKTLAKWAGYFLAAYLMASWGVNGVVAPVHYVKSWVMKEVKPEVIKQEGSFIVIMPQENMLTNVLSFWVAEAENYFFDVKITGFLANGDVEEMVFQTQKGWNSIDLKNDAGYKCLIKLVLTTDTIKEGGVVLENVSVSEYRKMDSGRTIYVLVSILFLTVFWECVWWIKERYAE